MSRAEKAKNYFLEGYNCSQSVLLAFQDVTGLDEETAFKISLPFGGGMGRMRLTCGAVSGMMMALGMVISKSELSPQNKKDVYAEVQKLANAYKEENGSLICGDLLTGAHLKTDTAPVPEERTKEYYKKRPCAMLVYSAAEILENYLKENNLV